MESQKKISKNEEIRVFDNGQNMDDLNVMVAYCCSAVWIPIRLIP